MQHATNWVVGSNVPGYLPDSTPFNTDSMSEAKMGAIDDMASQREALLDGLRTGLEAHLLYKDEILAIGAAVKEYDEEIAYLTNIEIEHGWSFKGARDPLSRHDLGILFWIEAE